MVRASRAGLASLDIYDVNLPTERACALVRAALTATSVTVPSETVKRTFAYPSDSFTERGVLSNADGTAIRSHTPRRTSTPPRPTASATRSAREGSGGLT